MTRPLLLAGLLLATACSESPSELGAQVASEVGCHSCHTGTDTDLAPTLEGLWGSMESLSDGSEILVDDVYVERSIVDPQHQIVAGYENGRMPTFSLTADEIAQLVAYVRGLG